MHGGLGELPEGEAREGAQQGGGALFDLGVYNLTSLCGFFGSVRRVTAMMGVAIPKREAEGEVKVNDKGTRMAKAVCPVCGTNLNRILGKA